VDTRITSTQNDFVKMAKTLKTKKGRNKNGAFLVEGEKCVRELMTHMPDILSSLIVSDSQYEDLTQRALNMGRRVYAVEEHVMGAISDCKTPQGIAAVALKPLHADVNGGFIVALDGVQDPRAVRVWCFQMKARTVFHLRLCARQWAAYSICLFCMKTSCFIRQSSCRAVTELPARILKARRIMNWKRRGHASLSVMKHVGCPRICWRFARTAYVFRCTARRKV
jgi:hypothetical protein